MVETTGHGANGLLDADEPAAFAVFNRDGAGRLLLVCDHAAHRVPRRLAGLGLAPARLATHIGWDPGAALVARQLARLLDAPLVLTAYSRLVIDCNRPLQSPESIPPRSDGVLIPGNQGLTAAQVEQRRVTLFHPYHQAIARLLDARRERPGPLLSIHSFTPVLNGETRPWPIGISSRDDPGLGNRLRAALLALAACADPRGQPGPTPESLGPIGDNQPYPIEDAFDYTLPTHGEARGLPSLMIELRQDGLGTAADCASWAARLAAAWRSLAVG
jgi:predicted N-formylglutamate amidohydrolase